MFGEEQMSPLSNKSVKSEAIAVHKQSLERLPLYLYKTECIQLFQETMSEEKEKGVKTRQQNQGNVGSLKSVFY